MKKLITLKKKLGEIYQEYFKFSFVRNPFDFLVSLYFYILNAKNHFLHKEIKGKNFDEFLYYYISLDPPLQTDFLMDQSGKKCIVDFIGRFENLEDDINEIKDLLGINKKNLDLLKHRNKSNKRISKKNEPYYNSDTIDFVNDYYKKDFILLGYNYEKHTKNIPLLSL